MATYYDIVNAAAALYANRNKYCYFYGAKNVVLTDERMNALWDAEPGYFSRYTKTQKESIFNYSRGKVGLDCSAYVCLVLETAGIITRSQWTYSTALIGECTNITANPASAASPAGSLLYSTFHNAGRHIGVDGGSGWFYDIGAEGDTIRHMKIADWGKWEKAGRYPGVDYTGATTASTRFEMPEGYLDYADKTEISGWTYDGTDARLTVHLYIYKDGKRVDLFPVTANVFRSDLKSAGKGDGKHAFSVNYDFATKLGVGSYTIKAYAINQAGTNNPQLQGEKHVNITQITTWAGKATTDVYGRVDANPKADAVLVIKTGWTVQVVGSKTAPDGGTWYKLIYNGKTMYANSKFIVKA